MMISENMLAIFFVKAYHWRLKDSQAEMTP